MAVARENQRVSVTMPRKLVYEIDLHRSYRSRSQFIYDAVDFYLKEKIKCNGYRYPVDTFSLDIY